jgi:Fic family protein
VNSYRRALTYVIQLSQDVHFGYSSSLIRSLHFMMTEYDLDASPGLWRPRGIWIRNEASGDIVYEGPDHELVPSLVEELVNDLQADESAVMVRAAMAHLNLVMIHPFRDGNGRMSRCLQTLVLAREGILVPEFSSIEEYLGRNTSSYYDILRDVGQGRWNPHNDARPWIRYCLTAHYIQAASVVRRVRESERLWQELESMVAQRSLPERSIEALFDAAIGLRVRNASYRSSLKSNGVEISNQTATNDLRALVDALVLAKNGQKRGTFYVASGELAAVYQKVRSTRTPINASQIFDPPQPQLFPSG